MMHLRIAGTTWLVCGVLGTGVSLSDFARNLASDPFDGAIASDLIAAVFCLAAAFAGYGLFRHKIWARVVCGVLGIILFLYGLSYLFMVGLEFGAICWALICIAVAFSLYSVFATIRYGPVA